MKHSCNLINVTQILILFQIPSSCLENLCLSQLSFSVLTSSWPLNLVQLVYAVNKKKKYEDNKYKGKKFLL